MSFSGQWDFGGGWCKVNSIINIGIWIEHIILFAILKVGGVGLCLFVSVSPWKLRSYRKHKLINIKSFIWEDEWYTKTFDKIIHYITLTFTKGRQDIRLCFTNRKISSRLRVENFCDSSSFMVGVNPHLMRSQSELPEASECSTWLWMITIPFIKNATTMLDRNMLYQFLILLNISNISLGLRCKTRSSL